MYITVYGGAEHCCAPKKQYIFTQVYLVVWHFPLKIASSYILKKKIMYINYSKINGWCKRKRVVK